MYKLIVGGGLLRSDGVAIPNDLSNTDYTEYVMWVDGGNTPEPADTPNPNGIINAQITAIESETGVVRVVREMMLMAMVDKANAVAAASGGTLTAEAILAHNVGYTRVKATDDQIKILRGQLT